MNPMLARLLALTCATAATMTALDGSATQAAAPPTTASILHVADEARPGLSRLLSAPPLGSGQERAIVTFASPPGAAQVAALRALGLVVQPLASVPVALVAGPRAALVAAGDIGDDVYPDEKLTYLDTESSNEMSATDVRRGPCEPRASPVAGQPSGSSTPAATAPTPTWPTTSSTT